MLNYEYTARDPATGNDIKAEITAENKSAAAKLITEQGYAPIEIKVKVHKKPLLDFTKRITIKDKVLFSRQLATLINAGMPLTQSLRTVSEQMPNKEFVIVINKIIGDVEGGSALAKAFKKHPDVFNEVYLSLVAAGEASGTLDEALVRLADQQEKDAAILSKVRGALIYPTLVLVVIVAVIIFMLLTVLPQVEQLYDDLKEELPLVTTLLLGISNFMIKFWWVLVIASIAGAWGLRQYAKTDDGRAKFDKFKMKMPLFGKLFMKLYMARFTRTGQTLMSTGVPMLEMMRISADAINNVHIKNSLIKATSQVKAGVSLSQSISKDHNFLSLVPQMIHIGEESGSIDDMMGKAATFYENELDNQIKAISTIIEPALMIVLALVAGVLVVAILLPIYGLVGSDLGF
jgi:type IV pilus assembly protein PilC